MCLDLNEAGKRSVYRNGTEVEVIILILIFNIFRQEEISVY